MPLYEYSCECGETFEKVRPIAERHNVQCDCGQMGKLKMSSWGRVLIAGWHKVVNSNGITIAAKQTTQCNATLPERVHGSRF